jgi:hypothetical protein
MDRKFTVIVVVAAVALVALAFWQRDAEPVDLAKGTATATPGPVLSMDPAQVQEVQVTGPLSKTYTLSRVAGGWQVDGLAASETVSSTVGSLVQTSALQTLGADRRPEDYGFASPSLTVTVKTADGQTTTFHVGDEVVGESSSSYIRLTGEGQPIHIVSNFNLKTLEEWLDTKPLAPTATPDLPTAPAADLSGTPGGTPGTPEMPAVIELPTDATGPTPSPGIAMTAAPTGLPTGLSTGLPTGLPTTAAATATPGG